MDASHYPFGNLQSSPQKSPSASSRLIFACLRNFGYIWPKPREDQMITVPLGEAKIIYQNWSMMPPQAKSSP